MRGILTNVSLIVRDKVTRQCPQPLKRKESRSAGIRTEVPLSAYQPNALPLGQTGSQGVVGASRCFYFKSLLSEFSPVETVARTMGANIDSTALQIVQLLKFIYERQKTREVQRGSFASAPLRASALHRIPVREKLTGPWKMGANNRAAIFQITRLIKTELRTARNCFWRQ